LRHRIEPTSVPTVCARTRPERLAINGFILYALVTNASSFQR